MTFPRERDCTHKPLRDGWCNKRTPAPWLTGRADDAGWPLWVYLLVVVCVACLAALGHWALNGRI